MDPFTPKAGYGHYLAHSFVGVPQVTRLDEHRVLKESRHDRREIDTMQFIAANTTIPVPKIYNTKFDKEKHISYIVMEYIDGEPLNKAWINLTQDQKVSTCNQLVDYLTQLQMLTGERIEAVNSSTVRVGLYESRWGGPFDSEKEFNDFLAQGLQQHNLTDNHAIHFAHGNLSPRNIMVNKCGRITAILDWEWAGWFPQYWDVVRMLVDIPGKRQMPDYAEHLRATLPYLYKEEYSAMLDVFRGRSSGPHGGMPAHATSRSR
ncbi:phosphotransferase enzyme family protein [Blastomyces dermatitidis ER-3]|uniref:Phosphotransferase enzyme family protein n=3 Tax=Blastomyces TaxID=229219 RepID=A0A179UKS1_BLAGS|nr:phosphotransferase enzyme family protein [Blastomyces gilchristii SLH14081]XP_045279914.1 phosphotransferase enzyme family protein [Blastomyces dermatitidis ER-3]OAT00187.1 phosphotransferase enzyme family protein [Blastomyces dermatitidis ER-3]OAT07757.1 phosphotransferase enzyme family protein [Blastomyces gilchristii SLH14081]